MMLEMKLTIANLSFHKISVLNIAHVLQFQTVTDTFPSLCRKVVLATRQQLSNGAPVCAYIYAR
jgi:hypothetical protein